MGKMQPTYATSWILLPIATKNHLFLYYEVYRNTSEVFLASAKSGIKNYKSLASKLFFKALEIGISGSYILSIITELLTKGVSDRDLIEAMTRIPVSEKEEIATQRKVKSKCNNVGFQRSVDRRKGIQNPTKY